MTAPLAPRVRLLVKGLVPPYLWGGLKWAKDRAVARRRVVDGGRRFAVDGAPRSRAPSAAAPPEWEHVPEGWARAADPAVKGWDVDGIVEAYRRRWPSFVRAVDGPGPLGVAHEVAEGVEVPREERGAHNTVMSFGYVLARAARGHDSLSMLDWGGGPGHYRLLAEALLPDVPLEYHSKDVPKLAALGRELVPDAVFHDGESCLDRRYELVLASGSLQYAEDWRGLLSRLAAAAAPFVYITRLPVAMRAPSFVVVQRPYAYGYHTEYLGWVVSRRELLDAAESARLRLEREFVLLDAAEVAGAPETPVQHRGFLFSRA